MLMIYSAYVFRKVIMQMRFLFIQGIGLLGTVLFFLSYQCRNNKKLFRVQFVSYLCYTVHLLLLGAVTGGISYILNTLRSFCLGSKSDFLKGKLICNADFYMERMVVDTSGYCQYCCNDRWIYIQCT